MAVMDQAGRGDRVLAGGLALLGGLVVVYAVLGPLVLDAIHFRTSASGLNQIRGGDLAALAVVAPSCFAIAWLAWRGHQAASILALAPGLFAMYMYSQLILANEYLYGRATSNGTSLCCWGCSSLLPPWSCVRGA